MDNFIVNTLHHNVMSITLASYLNEKQMKHTKGKWSYNGFGSIVSDQSEYYIASVSENPQYEDNIKILANSAAMYELLKERVKQNFIRQGTKQYMTEFEKKELELLNEIEK